MTPKTVGHSHHKSNFHPSVEITSVEYMVESQCETCKPVFLIKVYERPVLTSKNQFHKIDIYKTCDYKRLEKRLSFTFCKVFALQMNPVISRFTNPNPSSVSVHIDYLS